MLFPFLAANKAQSEVCFFPLPHAPQLFPPSDASPACSASKERSLHDKVQSRIIKLDEDRETGETDTDIKQREKAL